MGFPGGFLFNMHWASGRTVFIVILLLNQKCKKPKLFSWNFQNQIEEIFVSVVQNIQFLYKILQNCQSKAPNNEISDILRFWNAI